MLLSRQPWRDILKMCPSLAIVMPSAGQLPRPKIKAKSQSSSLKTTGKSQTWSSGIFYI